MGPIAVEMPPIASATAEQVAREEALLAACSEASAPSRCIRTNGDRPAEIIAVVSWQGEFAVRIEIAARSEGRWLERSLTFSPEDPELARWQATGLAIGTLVGAHEQEAPGLAMQDSEASDKAEARDSSDEAPESSSERSMAPNTNWTRGRASSEGPTGPSRIYIDAGLDGGTAWGAALRIGPSALLGLRLSSGLFIDLEGTYAASDNYFAQASTTFHTDWWTVAAGAGMSWQVGSSTLAELGLFPGVELQQISAPGVDGQIERPVAFVEGKLRLRQLIASRIWLRVSADVGMRLGETGVFLESGAVGTVPLVYGGLTLAASLDLFEID